MINTRQKHIFNATHIWIGLRRDNTEPMPKFKYESDQTIVNFTNFSPDIDTQKCYACDSSDCVYMQKNGKWYIKSCAIISSWQGYLCQTEVRLGIRG